MEPQILQYSIVTRLPNHCMAEYASAHVGDMPVFSHYSPQFSLHTQPCA